MILKTKAEEKHKQTPSEQLRLKTKLKQQQSIQKDAKKYRKCFGKYLNSQNKHVSKHSNTHRLGPKANSHDIKKNIENGQSFAAIQSGKRMNKITQK